MQLDEPYMQARPEEARAWGQQALNRALTLLAYHTGQIVYLAKYFRSDSWKALSVPRGKSEGNFPLAVARSKFAPP